MRLGIGSYAFAWAIGVKGRVPAHPLDAPGLIGKAVALGARVVQICDNLPLALLDETEVAALETRAARGNISIEVGARGLDPGELRRYVALAKRLGSPFLRLVIDRPGDEPSPDEAATRLEPLLPDLTAAGVKLAIENHDRFSVRTLERLVRRLGPELVGICLDTVNSFGALEGPEAVLEALGPHVLSLHVKDFTIRRPDHQMGFLIEGCPAGKGRLDLPWLLGSVQKHRPSANAILELWTPPLPSLDETIAREDAWARQSVEHLRTLISA